MNNPLLEVENLSILFKGAHEDNLAVRDVSFQVGREKVAIVGESGSGKSQTCRALLKLTPKIGQVRAAKMRFGEFDLLNASERQMRTIRGNRISMILQDPRFSLNPLMRIGDQVAEAWRLHRRVSKEEARARALEMLESVHIREVAKVARLYPHEISGGMGQRVMIAMMLIPEPDLIIADEPTSALDVTVRRQVLSILDEQLQRRQTGLLFITHDLNLVSRFCDRVLVMYAGRIVEEIRASELDQACHPYTQALLASQPRLREPVETLRVPTRDPAWLNGPSYRNGVAQ
ncbi:MULTISPECIES: ABC transporter ATP-binding protein [Kosakonia]|uniref:ABC-type dipeptide transporter n=2 Tax=Kosakonia TaxID=1330547 RepID=A0AA94H572_9ENTR|nr:MULTISPECIES: ABC transporter ATP-binding protein [Kosakonia]ANI81583.1 ABC transporter ATP-binding protein [Kosakonia oryzae]APG19504.1 peptide ABC transporter ATP-binding protein [Kosakonia radicincitans]KDE33369.1 peptide ABC transporter substrate-binding protein [Kosakonia radicincitans UMEnt01/12]MDD7995456.1 ABC transporter ATP-binding protein [Kosakonia radicincitans]MDP9565955.1 peptide/nickel transport system ATP-binding protein [Kosakonia oryzae]